MPVLCNFDLGRNPRLESEELNGPTWPARSGVDVVVDRGRAAQDAVLPILVPAYVIAVTGGASHSGVVMGVLMLTGALVRPRSSD